MKKEDIILSILSGGGVAWLVNGMIKTSGIKSVLGVNVTVFEWFLYIFLPILTVFILWVSYQVGKKFLFVVQIAKFVLIGVLATLFDLIVFRSLGWVSGLSTKGSRTTFKGISFLGATLAKYWGNKFWAFEQAEMKGAEKEFTQFFIVTLMGLGINVGAFYLFVNIIGPLFGIPFEVWETLGVILAALAVSVWNFVGYKFIVFKK